MTDYISKNIIQRMEGLISPTDILGAITIFKELKKEGFSEREILNFIRYKIRRYLNPFGGVF